MHVSREILYRIEPSNGSSWDETKTWSPQAHSHRLRTVKKDLKLKGGGKTMDRSKWRLWTALCARGRGKD